MVELGVILGVHFEILLKRGREMKFSMDALRKRGVVGLAIPLIFSFYLELFVGTEAQAGECQRAL